MRIPLLGGIVTGRPRDPKQFPRFPIMIIDDVPFLASRYSGLAGQAENPLMHLKYFREECDLRTTQLHPPADITGLLARATEAESVLEPGAAEQVIGEQVLLMLNNVYTAPVEYTGGPIALNRIAMFHWTPIKADLAKLSIKWNPETNQYVPGRPGAAVHE